jgi:MtN3 and saliva related transmembrane protein
MMDSALTAFVTTYGVLGALSSLLQVRRMLSTRSSDDVSVLFLGVYSGGYLVWLVYGLIKLDTALIIVDAVGMVIALTTLTVALRLRMVERGQSLIGALRDEAKSSPPQMQWLGRDDQTIKRVPPGLKSSVSNRCYPAMILHKADGRDQLKHLAELKATSPVEKFFLNPTIAWRVVDSQDARESDYRDWRRCLSDSLELCFSQPARPAFLEIASQELLRPDTLAPVSARLPACRAATLWAAWTHLPAAQLGFDRPEQMGQYQLGALSQRWAEQALGMSLLSSTEKPSQRKDLKATLQPVAEFCNPKDEVWVVNESWQALLWPSGAGASELFGGPDPLPKPALCNSWLREAMAVRRSYLLAARPRSQSRARMLSPLDRSINEGFASLVQLLARDLHDPRISSLYPLERGLVQGAGLKGGLGAEGVCRYLLEVEVSEGATALAALCGVSASHLEQIYKSHYLKFAKALLLKPEPYRIAACWRSVL